MNIKICCPVMESYIDSLYVRLHFDEPDWEVVICTAMYDENEVQIDYCPWCGKKLEIKIN